MSNPNGNNAGGGNKADNVIRNIGAAAEATALFYNTVAKQVPAEAALELTKQYMTVTFTPRKQQTQIKIPAEVMQDAVKRALADIRKKEEEERREQGEK